MVRVIRLISFFVLIAVFHGKIHSQCEITTMGLTDISCNDNSTPTDTLDDYIQFSLNPTGNGISSFYSITVSSGSLNSGTGQFNVPTTFFLQSGSAGAGDLTITIADLLDPSCTNDTILPDPGPCSSLCEILDANLNMVECNDNATPTIPSDDFISFELNPSGNQIDSAYIIMVSNGTVNPDTGAYGSPVSFLMQSGSAGGGDVLISIIDIGDLACITDTLLLDPGTCSPVCDMVAVQLNSISCNNNGTNNIPEDDFISFTLNPVGNNLTTAYEVIPSQGAVSPSVATYGSITAFQLDDGSAGNGNVWISVVDTMDGSCILDTIIMDPGSCSPDCSIFDAGLSDVDCFDNNTDSTGIDDIITFNLNPFGSNLGEFYTVSVSQGSVEPIVGVYGEVESFQLQIGSAGSGDVIVTITDIDDNTCSHSFTLSDPGPCSSLCEMLDAQLANVICNDNGTDDEPSDDFISFSLNPIGIELVGSYELSVVPGSVEPGSAIYDTTTFFALIAGSAGGGDTELHVQDSLVEDCFLDIIIEDTGSCSPECKITDPQLDSLQCNDNGTISDASDDYISFVMTPIGNNLGETYTVLVSEGTIVPDTGVFGITQLFELQGGSAGAGDVMVKIKNVADESCPLDVLISDPGSCSPVCDIYDLQLGDIICNNNGTTSNDTDDYLSFTLEPLGFNVDSMYLVQVSNGSIAPSQAEYGVETEFLVNPGSAGAGDLILTIFDGQDSLCFTEVLISDTGSCSPDCEITTLNFANLECNDNGTVHDTMDDYLSFELDPQGFNLDTSYMVELSSGEIDPMIANYGIATSFELQPGSAGGGNITILVTDINDTICQIPWVLEDPGYCSDVCLITDVMIDSLMCNDNGTTSDASDDFVSLYLRPTGGNTATNYDIEVLNGEIEPQTGNYSAFTKFSFHPGSAGSGNISIRIIDQLDSNCVYEFEITAPETCSPDCEIISAEIQDVICSPNGTTFDGSDDIIQFELNATGFNTGENYILEFPGTSWEELSGEFGIDEVFHLPEGSAGDGGVPIVLYSAEDPTCKYNVFISDPGSCSPECLVSDVLVTEFSCFDNNTSSDNSDDLIVFNIDISGFNLEGSFSLFPDIGNVLPVNGDFSNPNTVFELSNAAGAGDIEIILQSDTDNTCFFSFILTDPGTCSPDCKIVETNLSNIICEDNNTSGDPTDDIIRFTLAPDGFNLSDTYQVMTLNGDVNPTEGTYGTGMDFMLDPGSAGSGNNLITIVDGSDDSCDKNIIISDPGSCSEECQINTSNLNLVECNDNGTPSDTLDDFISFVLDPEGYNLSGEYLVFALNGIVNPTSAEFGEITSFSLHQGSAGNGEVEIMILDMEDNDCDFSIIIPDPGTCSDASSINESSVLSSIKCYPNPVIESLIVDHVPEGTRIEIRNIFGFLVYSDASPDYSRIRLDISSYADGVYFVSFYHDKHGEVSVKRILKE